MTFKLVCFDLDGTLIEEWEGHGYWGTLHRVVSGEEQGSATQSERLPLFRNGQLSYSEWVDLDLNDFKRAQATREQFVEAAKRHRLAPGARETVMALHERGILLAVISGSVDIHIETLFPDHPFADVFVNKVFFREGVLDSWKATIYDEGTKHHALHVLCEREGIALAETVFVGNGENDIDALEEAGLGIAYRPESEKVREAADVVIDDLREILTHL